MSIKVGRVAKMIKNHVGRILLHELADPRMGFVTVTNVEVSPDFKTAKVFVSVLGTEAEQRRTMHGLRHAAGHVQRLIGQRMRIRNTPYLSFVHDRSVERAIELSMLIDRAVAGAVVEDDDRVEGDATVGEDGEEAAEAEGS